MPEAKLWTGPGQGWSSSLSHQGFATELPINEGWGGVGECWNHRALGHQRCQWSWETGDLEPPEPPSVTASGGPVTFLALWG